MKPGRNDPCPCGSGDKYKKCCARLAVAPAASAQTDIGLPHYASALRSQSGPAAPSARAASLSSDDADFQVQRGFELLDGGQLQGAATHFERLVARWPLHAEAHDALGLVYLEQGAADSAVEQHRRALALDPRRAEAHGNLGNALAELGDHVQAIEHYRALLKQRPALAEAHNNLGNALLALRRFDEAARSYRQALALRPDAPGALLNLGNALREAGRPMEAMPFCRRVLELRPGQADGFRLLGHIQSDLGDLDPAIGSYRRSLELARNSEETLLGLGKTLRRMGRTDEAGAAAREALALKADSGDALALLGELAADHGRFDEANALLRRAIAASPDQPEAWAALAQYRSMRGGDAEWLSAVERVLARPLTAAQQINLRFALGKFYDDQGRYAEAFENFRAANDLQKESGPKFDRSRLQQQVERIVRNYDGRWMAAHRHLGAAAQLPVFVVGMPRSGTSLIEQILASHPAVFGAGELRYWNLAAARFQRSRGDAGPDLKLPDRLAQDYLQLLAARAPRAERVVDKMPANFMHLGLIHAALPGARIIHVRRNPLDTLLSIYFQAFSGTHAYSHDLSDLAFYYGQYRALMQHWRAVLEPGVVLEVEYEALIRDPETWIRRLVSHAGLSWDARCLAFHETDRVVATASNWQVRQTLNTRGIDRWRNYETYLAPLMSLLEEPNHDG